MGRLITVFLSCLLASVLLFSSCSLINSPGKQESSTSSIPENTAEQSETVESTSESTSEVTTEAATEATTVTTTETTTQKSENETAELPTSSPDTVEVVKGVTSKGYEIIEVNGVTYVNGILIANKTYSLPQSYNPGGLTEECKAAFLKMQADAQNLGVDLFVLSGFRSYQTQNSLYTRYCEADGKELADTYSARPGHSEHQSGLAIDVNSVMQAFADTKEGRWLKENCFKYGFILRYPEEKQSVTGYCYEPWHIRYVGVELATAITESGLCLEEYLGISSQYTY